MNDALLSIALLLNALEDPFVFALLVSAVTLVIGLFKREYGLAFFCSIALTFAAVHITKSIFEIARPADALASARGYRFPSMHAAIAATSIGSIAWYISSRLSSPRNRTLILCCAAGLITFIAWTRLLLGVHHLIDVVVGATLGLIVSFGIHLLVRRYALH